jgi:hypothetical protein
VPVWQASFAAFSDKISNLATDWRKFAFAKKYQLL